MCLACTKTLTCTHTVKVINGSQLPLLRKVKKTDDDEQQVNHEGKLIKQSL